MRTREDFLAAALRHLPHGPEFRFLDRLLELDPGKLGLGEYTVRGDEAFLRGHFPGNPLMPGVLLIEAGAQLAGVVAQSDPTTSPLSGLKLTALRAVKIFGSVAPGEVISIRAQIIGRLGGLVQATAEVHAGAQRLLVAELTLAGQPGTP